MKWIMTFFGASNFVNFIDHFLWGMYTIEVAILSFIAAVFCFVYVWRQLLIEEDTENEAI